MLAAIERDVAVIQNFAVVPTMLDTLCRLTGMEFAGIARVTERHWVSCSMRDDAGFGLLPGSELPVETTMCNEIRVLSGPIVIDDVDIDPIYANHHALANYGVKSFVGVPIMLTGERFFGTLCAVSKRVVPVSRPEILNTFKMFADLLALHLDAHDRLGVSEADLREERNTAQLREQFIAVLGHDLRQPLASIAAGSYLLDREVQTEKSRDTIALMRASATRMGGLIDNILDFARGRLGGGLTLERRRVAIAPLLAQVVAEVEAAFPDRIITTPCGDEVKVDCDPRRVAQLMSNLLGNAITHGAADAPIRVDCRVEGGTFELAVINSGLPIPVTAQARLFQPFDRGPASGGKDGLGLGLYIASEIAAAHGGTLSVISSDEETRFTFRMPAGD